MKHAIRNGQKRIIIAIPYTSIIVQTASVLRSIFGEENVLEHHSNVDPEHIKDERLQEKMKLATENWDYPIMCNYLNLCLAISHLFVGSSTI